MNAPANADTVSFLRAVFALYGDDPLPDGQVVGICEMSQGKPPRRFPATSPEAAAEKVAGIGSRSHAYFETATGPAQVSGGRLCAEEAQSVGHVRLDIDLASPHRKGNKPLPATEQDARAALAPLFELLPPSLTVWSGYGLQLYWIFKEPCDLTNGNERRQYIKAHAAFHGFALQLMQKAGFELDNVADLARLMRIPGGFNVKNPADPRLVTFEDHGLRYTIEDIRDELPEIIEERPDALPEIDASPLSVDPSEVLRMIDAWREIDPGIDSAWKCKKKGLADSSPSGQVMSFVAQVVACDSDGAIPDSHLRFAIAEFYRRNGATPEKQRKGERRDIQDQIIRKARDTSRVQMAAEASHRVVEEYAMQRRAAVVNEGGEAVKKMASQATPKILDALTSNFGFKVLAVKKYSGDPASFVLETNVGNVDLGQPETFASQTKFRSRVMGVTGCVIPTMKKRQFDDVLQAMLDAAEVVDLGPEASTVGILREEVRLYISSGVTHDLEGALVGKGSSAPSNCPVCQNGKYYIRLSSLREHLSMKRVGIPGTDIPKLLVQGGFVERSVKIDMEDGTRAGRNGWLVPAELAPDQGDSDNPFA